MSLDKLIEKYEKANIDYAGMNCYKEFLADLKDVQSEQAAKVKVPKFVADYIDFAKQCLDLNVITTTHWTNVKSNLGELSAHEFRDWLATNAEFYCKAWLDGYEVEEEPWEVSEGDLVIKKGKHEAKVYFVEYVDREDDEVTSVLLVNGIADLSFEENIDDFFKEWRLLAKSENLEKEVQK